MNQYLISIKSAVTGYEYYCVASGDSFDEARAKALLRHRPITIIDDDGVDRTNPIEIVGGVSQLFLA